MDNRGVAEIGLSESGGSNQLVSYGIHGITQSATNFFDQEGAAYFGELEKALMQGVTGISSESETKTFLTNRPPPTLDIFPSWPARFQQASGGNSQSAEEGGATESSSAQNTLSQLESDSPMSIKGSSENSVDQKMIVSDSAKTAAAPNHHPKIQDKRRVGGKDGKLLDSKTLRRLAQNREAARKSRLRKKAYVQQLETSRIKLTQLEQDLHRARSQGLFVGGAGVGGGSTSSSAAIFEVEYGRWLDENYKHMSDLREAIHVRIGDGELRLIVDENLAHHDELFRLKGVAARADVFHIITGLWVTPAERCFLWMGGFRPSELLKVLMAQLDPLTEQQLVAICGLQQSSQQAEEALSQGLEQLHHSLAETVSAGFLGEFAATSGGEANSGNYMAHMVIALGKLSNLDGFVRQADHLRRQTLHQMRQILTVRQAARWFLAMGEYYCRLRALSSLWTSRPRENMALEERDQQILSHPPLSNSNQFSSF